MTPIDAVPVALLGAILGMDVVTFPQAMISRPIVASTLAGALAGNATAGLVMGAVLELLALEMLPFGASRYPEWGSASVVGGSLYAAQHGEPVGALPASLLAALVTAMFSGWSMVRLRRLNAAYAARMRERLDSGSARAVTGVHLFGLTGDLLRGFLVTLLAMLAFGHLVAAISATWGGEMRVARGVVVAMVAAVSAGAMWKLFHGVPQARVLFLAGLGVGAIVLVAA